MISVAYVSPEGRPELSFRGSVQAYSDTQLAIWVRNPEGGHPKGRYQRASPYRPALRRARCPVEAFVTFRGRGVWSLLSRVRRKVYDDSPEGERNLDKDRKA